MKTNGKKFSICIDGWDPYWGNSGHYFLRIPFYFNGREPVDEHPREWEASGDAVVLAFQARHGVVEEIVKESLASVKEMFRAGELDVCHPLFGDDEGRNWVGLDDVRADAYCAESWLEWEDEATEGWPNGLHERKE